MMENYREKISVMNKDDLALELEKLQGHASFFERAEANWRDPREREFRLQNDNKIKLVRKLMASRQPQLNEEKRHDHKQGKETSNQGC